MTTLSAVVRIVDLPAATTITGAELFEIVQTTAGVGLSVQVPISQVMTTSLGGLPTGGGTSQILAKASGTNFSAAWYDVTQFISINTTSLATTGSGTALVIGVKTAGIGSGQLGALAVQRSNITSFAIGSGQIDTAAVGSSQLGALAVQQSNITSNAIGTAQLASSLGIASSLSVGTLLTVGGTATFNGTAIFNATSIFNGAFGITGTTLITGTFGVVGTAQFTSGAFNVIGTTLFTSGRFGVVGSTLFTGTFGIVGTSLMTGSVQVIGSASFSGGTFGVLATSLFTGVFGQVGTSLMTGQFGVVGTSIFTSGLFGVIGTSILTGTFAIGNSTTGIMWSSSTGVITATTNIATGLVVTVFSVGNATTGTITPSPLNGNYQYLTNNGAFTIAAYTTFDFALDLLVQNGTAPGAIGFSGWREGTNIGDTIGTTGRLIASAVIATGSPGIMTVTAHLSNVNDPVWFSTSGALPTGMTSGTLYYISTTTANTFQIATTAGTTTSINLSSTQSGTHTATLVSQYLLSFRSMHFVPTYLVKALQ